MEYTTTNGHEEKQASIFQYQIETGGPKLHHKHTSKHMHSLLVVARIGSSTQAQKKMAATGRYDTDTLAIKAPRSVSSSNNRTFPGAGVAEGDVLPGAAGPGPAAPVAAGGRDQALELGDGDEGARHSHREALHPTPVLVAHHPHAPDLAVGAPDQGAPNLGPSSPRARAPARITRRRPLGSGGEGSRVWSESVAASLAFPGTEADAAAAEKRKGMVVRPPRAAFSPGVAALGRGPAECGHGPQGPCSWRVSGELDDILYDAMDESFNANLRGWQRRGGH